VLSERGIDFGYKRSMYNQTEKDQKARTGSPVTNFDINLHFKHQIDMSKIPPNKGDLKRILKKDPQIWGNERTLMKGKRILLICRNKLHLPSRIFAGAFLLFKKLHKELGDFSGRSLETLTLACIYYIARGEKCPLFISELLENTKTSRRRFKQTYNFIVNKLGLKTPPVNIRIYLDKFCYKLNLPYKLHKKVKNYFNEVPKSFIQGKNPKVIIATILYVVVKEHNLDITQRKVAEELDISSQAIRLNMRKVRKYI
jgi:transcription initiation factor TFIIIB Brf1 subunit/transcription initiation factor TFIIB